MGLGFSHNIFLSNSTGSNSQVRFSSWNHEIIHYPLTHVPLESLRKLNQAVDLRQENELFCNNLLLSKEMWHTEYLTLLKINAYWVNGIRTELGVSLLSQNRDLNTQRNTQSELSKRGNVFRLFISKIPGMRRYTTIIHSFILISCKV